MPTKHLDGKVAVVTGGAGGVGSWISRIFAEQGASVVVADTGADVEGRMGVDPTRVNEVVAQIKDAGGTTIVQDPSDARVAGMPLSALEADHCDFTLPILQIGPTLVRLVMEPPDDDVYPPAPHEAVRS